MKRWLLAGVTGLLLVAASVGLWDVWVVNMAGTSVNRAIVATADAKTEAEIQSLLDQAMALMTSLASRPPHSAAREIPIWRTYGAAASMSPTDYAFALLLTSRMAGRLDRTGELWLAEVAAATQHWDEAEDAYRRVDASNVLIHRAEEALQAGDEDLAVRQFQLAKASLEAAIEREDAELLLVDQTDGPSSAMGRFMRPPSERVTALFRIGRGLLQAGQPFQAVPVLKEARRRAQTDSPGAGVEQSLALTLALALARTLPDPPAASQPVYSSYYSSYYALDPETAAWLDSVISIRTLIYQALASDHTAAVCLQAARVLVMIGDDQQARALFEESIALDPRLPETYLGLGGWYESKGMIISARELYKTGLAESPADPRLAVALALAAYKTLPAENALPLLEEAARSETQDPYLFANLGDCYLDLDRDGEARAAYEEGLKRSPEAEPLVERLRLLEVPVP